MKMRWVNRALELLGGLVLVALAVCLLLSGIAVVRNGSFSIDSMLHELRNNLFLFVVAVVLLMILGLLLVFFAVRKKRGRYYAVQTNDTGSVQISIQAIDHMVHRCLQRYTEISLGHVHIGGQHDAVIIRLRMAVRSDVYIPELVSEIRRDVKEYVESCSGVKVERVEVMVDATKDVEQRNEAKHAVAMERTPLLPPTAEPVAPPEDQIVQENLSAPAISVGDGGVFDSETPEPALVDERDPIYVSGAQPEDPIPAPKDAVSAGETSAADTALEEQEDELAVLDAFEPEIEDHETSGESDEM
jgi:hypothetical protein